MAIATSNHDVIGTSAPRAVGERSIDAHSQYRGWSTATFPFAG
ncbi:hypothetical protein [Kutzneria chonburiensis]|uniref:Uncharacterized protein n=1 Tax=Kutzneria chonburiensis TaxID=1483604 RepID=A0ABV6N0W0_9PSEU|nr:hypothetical protein [Kutzneria chonburiensis]